MLEIAAQEGIEAFAAEFGVEIVQEQSAFLIRNTREALTRIAVTQIDGQDLIGGFELLKIGLQGLESQHRLHGGARLTVYRGHDATFHVIGESFVEPEIPPGRIADQISRPGMRQFMRDHRHQALVPHDYGGRDERQPRILHAAFRKTRRHHQDVVPRPAIRPEHLFVGLDHGLGVREFLGRRLDHGLLGIHARARAGFLVFQIAHGKGDQVGRHGLRHDKSICNAEAGLGLRVTLRAHNGTQLSLCIYLVGIDLRFVSGADLRGVLKRDPGARADRLRFGIEEWFVPGGLFLRQPLQRG